MPKTNHPKHVKLIQKKLQEVLDDGNIDFDELDQYTGHYCIIKGKSVEIGFDDEKNHKIGFYRLLLKSGQEYLLSISFSINTTTRKPKSISVTIYTLEKIKLFKGEWAAKDNSGIEHAQPHWHIHYPKKESDGWKDPDDKDFKESEEINVYDGLDKIHFAMCATWHEDNNHSTVLDTMESKHLTNWIAEVLNYIQNELVYLHNKSLLKK